MYDAKLEQWLLCSLDRSVNETNKTSHDIFLPTYDTLLCEIRIFEAQRADTSPSNLTLIMDSRRQVIFTGGNYSKTTKAPFETFNLIPFMLIPMSPLPENFIKTVPLISPFDQLLEPN
jgi:hypothetical protein